MKGAMWRVNKWLRCIIEYVEIRSADGVITRSSLLNRLCDHYFIVISEGTLRDDLSELKNCRFPIQSSTGCLGGYYVDIQPGHSLFTATEMQAVIDEICKYEKIIETNPENAVAKQKFLLLTNILRKMTTTELNPFVDDND